MVQNKLSGILRIEPGATTPPSIPPHHHQYHHGPLISSTKKNSLDPLSCASATLTTAMTTTATAVTWSCRTLKDRVDADIAEGLAGSD